MREEYKSLFQYLGNSVHEYVTKYDDNENHSMYIRSRLAEAYLAIESLLENQFIEAHERVILERDLAKIYNQVYSEESLFYYSSFHYAYQNVKSNNVEKIQNQFQKINLDVMTMLLNVRSIMKGESDLGSSTDDYFFSRMENCTWAFSYIIKNDLEDYFVPSLYCICNMMQTLSLYYKAGKSKYRDRIKPLMNLLDKELNKYLSKEKVQKIIDSNYQLKYFLINQLLNHSDIDDGDYKPCVNIDEILNERVRGTFRILTSIYNINIDKFKQYFDLKIDNLIEKAEEMDILDKILFLRVLSNYFKSKGDEYSKFELGLYEEVIKINTEDFINQVFDLNQIDITSVEKYHLEKLMKMKDDELRVKFSKTIRGVSKRVLERESRKPHGAFEISDMEVPIMYKGKKYYLCMPFKSGVEITGKTVPVDVSYQIVRPFIEFRNCMVVFVTAKKCSENLMNYIKKIKDSLGWPIEVIEENVLAGLLMMNGEL
ncbi:hypothetical protein [Anaerosalibacter massiliensis]|uniref:Uncharacterized protein n=1 Tax=Anaerosalibacter massiliensis TaxID=1347392 RepID=A0A9X2MHG3_9FIRM|nr:hypothetical protein [Anaerosalibacter massiliensis]MCR2043779.1 hypothetical protein [Anaerosalibacter massiliensis]